MIGALCSSRSTKQATAANYRRRISVACRAPKSVRLRGPPNIEFARILFEDDTVNKCGRRTHIHGSYCRSYSYSHGGEIISLLPSLQLTIETLVVFKSGERPTVSANANAMCGLAWNSTYFEQLGRNGTLSLPYLRAFVPLEVDTLCTVMQIAQQTGTRFGRLSYAAVHKRMATEKSTR